MPESTPGRVLLVAGEASGDLHGGYLVRELQSQLPGIQIAAVGGDCLRACHVDIVADVRLLSAVGLVEIIGSLRRHYRVMELLKRQMDQHRPDVVVLVDYPGFNMFVAKEAKKRGIPIFYYIAPQVWAWGKSRAKKMEQLIDRLAVIFPFEEAIFNAYGRDFAHYVGHPLVDELYVSGTPEQIRSQYGLSISQPLLVLMPGSRRAEVRLLLPAMLQAAKQLKINGWQVVLLKAPTVDRSFLEKVSAGQIDQVNLIEGDTHNLLHAADAGVIASGTATLEAALLGCPHVILYRFAWLTYLIAKLMIGRRIIGLPNVILGRPLFPEIIQRDVTPDNIIRAVLRIVEHGPSFDQAISELQVAMGPAGASRRAAQDLLELIR
ncbi:MAG: lipid-A-disaccharide synthase [Synechococcus sp.]|jgi:lipid-A-disaccharide synthase|nr:lipid-A-disaccharide synthase [Synechococcus sp.]